MRETTDELIGEIAGSVGKVEPLLGSAAIRSAIEATTQSDQELRRLARALRHDITILTGPAGSDCVANIEPLIRSVQQQGGTVIWTLPSGHTYVGTPGSAPLFPALAVPTGDLLDVAHFNSGLMPCVRRGGAVEGGEAEGVDKPAETAGVVTVFGEEVAQLGVDDWAGLAEELIA